MLWDLAQTYIHRNAVMTNLDKDPHASITSQGLIWQFFNAGAWMATPYCNISLQYYQVAAVGVALNLWSSEDWPEPYGRWKDAYTLRNFWGRVWHQMLRRFIVSVGKSVSVWTECEKGSWRSAYTQLYVGFFVSGIMHSFGDVMVGRQYMGSSIPFFMTQAVAITLEDSVIQITNSLGVHIPRWLQRLIGYAWVVCWLTMSIPWYVDWAVRAGLGAYELLPLSPIRHISKYLYGGM